MRKSFGLLIVTLLLIGMTVCHDQIRTLSQLQSLIKSMSGSLNLQSPFSMPNGPMVGKIGSPIFGGFPLVVNPQQNPQQNQIPTNQFPLNQQQNLFPSNLVPLTQSSTHYQPNQQSYSEYQGEKAQGIYLESHSNKCLQRQYCFQGGQITLKFDYKVLSQSAVKSTVYVILDGQPIYTIDTSTPTKTIKIERPITKGHHTIGFCAAGSPNDIPHQILISNIKLFEDQCVGGWGPQLMVNGDFEDNDCQGTFCVYEGCNYEGKNMSQKTPNGWIANPELEVYLNAVYNPAFKSKWSSELSGCANTCIGQRVPLKKGKFLISFDWGARKQLQNTIKEKGMDLKLNGKVLKSYSAVNFDLNKQQIEFPIGQVAGDSLIELCGTGLDGDRQSLTIDNVKVFSYDECQKRRTIQF